jgi:predicted ferric reductase
MRNMKYNVSRVLPWVGAYVALALAPLVLAMVGSTPEPRPFFVEVGVGLGFVGIGLIGLQFVITGRFRSIAPIFGGDVVLQFHRQIGIVAVVLVLAHPAVLVLSEPDYLEFFDPRVNLPRALALTAVVPALILLLVTSLWREFVRLNYEWWRVGHGVLALAVVFIGMVHGIQVGEHLDALWKQIIWVGTLVGLMYLVIHTRVVRPMLMKRRPYRVAEVRRELPDTYTLVLEPDGHVGMNFTAGQYAWMTVGPSPYSLQQHPFSFSSSAHSGELTFTAKAIGDFTSSWDEIEPGECVFLEGPFGAFTLDPDSDGAVFIAGGIGVTPTMSILRTMRDTDDDRPVVLIYGNPDLDSITFREELDELTESLDLRVVHVLEDPSDCWSGEEGYIDRALLERNLPPDCRTYEFFICGPEPMMDAAETALRDMGISWRQIYTERFQIV